MSTIIVNSVSKSYKGVIAIEDISFEASKGELFGFIGPDGAGKTTLFRILATLLLADKGEVTLNDLDVIKDYKKIRKILGYMPGRFSLYQDLTVEENLQFFATIFGTTIRENYHLIKDIYVHLEPFKKRLAGKLSGGMKQKLALSCALIHKPEILILDEPTTGVDAVSRKEFWEMLKNLKSLGITIIVSTPYMDEATICDKVALIQSGRIMEIDTPVNIVNGSDKIYFAIKSNDIYRLLIDLRSYFGENYVYPFGQYVHLSDVSGKISEETITIFLLKNNHDNIEVKRIEPNIEDCFLDLMKRNK
jgi:ABC-2 type transport system ATP-binding protein